MSSPDGAVRVLLVEDDPDDHLIVRTLLEEVDGRRTDLTWARTYDEGLQQVQEVGWDVVLADYRLGARTGLEFLGEERVRATGTPLILLTGQGGRDVDLEATRAGAADFLAKKGLTSQGLERSIRYAVEAGRRHRMEARFRALIENSRDLIRVLDAGGSSLYVSPSVERVLGFRPEEKVGEDLLEGVHPDDRRRVETAIREVLREPRSSRSFRGRVLHRDGSYRVLDSVARNLLHDPFIEGIVVNSWDLTDLDRTEAELRDRQRDLQERVKELRCLYRVSRALHRRDRSWDDVLREVAASIPPGFRFSDAMAAAVRLEDPAGAGEGSRPQTGGLSASVRVDGERVGAVEAWFIREPPVAGDPFLPEERDLMQAIAERVGEAAARRRAEEELQRSEAYFRSITERSGLAVVVVDADGTIRYAGGEVSDLLGREPAGVVGENIIGLVDPEERERTRALLRAAVEEPGVLKASVARVQGGAGEGRLVEYTVRSLLDDPAVGGVVVTARDVTEREERERRVRFQAQVLDRVAHPVFATDYEGRVTYWNPAAERVFGWSAEEMLGRIAMDLMVPRDLREVVLQAREEGRSGRAWEGELRLFRKDGSTVIMWVTLADIRPETGPGPGRIVAGMDVTELRRAERELEEQRQFLQFQADLLDAVGQAVIATDLEGRVIHWNRAARDLYGWSREEALGRDVVEVIPSDQSREEAAALMEALRRGERWNGEIELRRKDGTTFPALVTDAPLTDSSGALVGIVGVSSDLSDRKELEQQLRQAQKMEAIGRLAGGVAHDFNNLLTAIHGHAELLIQDLPRNSAMREDLLEIQVAGRRAADLTRQLLTFSRKQVLQARTVDLRRVVKAMEPMLRRLIRSSVEIRIEAAEADTFLWADPNQIQQVVLNLAVNAADAMAGGGVLEITIDAVDLGEADVLEIPWEAREGPYVRLTVGDTGIGMGPEVLAHLFEPFYTTKPEGKGTGLGMATVFGIVKQSGGHIFVDSEPGEGTTFRILLPRVEGEVEAEEEPADARRPPVPGHETILLVEDDPSVRRLASRVLRRVGYEVLEAGNGRQALEIADARARDIQLVVSDVVMPEMGGTELIERLHERFADVPVVLCSGYSEEDLSGRARPPGALFLRKPFEPDELTRTVREGLEGR